MSRSRGRCIHCLVATEGVTSDHVFPKSWYPDNTSDSVQRWTAPSCSTCNGNLGKLEKELFVRLAMCIDPNIANASGISQKALRSVGVNAPGISQQERRHRAALRDRILSEISPYDPTKKPFPGLGIHSGYPDEMQNMIPVPADELNAVAEKIVRGCEHYTDQRYIEAEDGLRIYFVDRENEPGVYTKIRPLYVGPGFEIRKGATPDEPVQVLYRITIWGTLDIYAYVKYSR